MQQSTWAENCQGWADEYATYAEAGIRPARMLGKARGYAEGARREADEAEADARKTREASDKAMQVAMQIFSFMASKMGIATEGDAAIQTVSVAAMRTAHYLVIHDHRPRAAFFHEGDALRFMASLAEADAAHVDTNATCEVIDRNGNRVSGYRTKSSKVVPVRALRK